MKLLELMENRVIFFDGGTGTELYDRGLFGNTALANHEAPDAICEIHRAYIEAGADIITANTFAAYKHSFGNFNEMIKDAFALANKARAEAGRDVYIAMDLGPTGLMLEPYGDVTVEECKEIFSESVKVGIECGADLILIETIMDINELTAAVEAASETGLPIFVSMSFNVNGRTMYGASIDDMVKALDSAAYPNVHVIGLNCGFGPVAYKSLVDDLLQKTNKSVILQPNAGMPETIDGVQKYAFPPTEFAKLMLEYIGKGVKVMGGCCGTTPGHIKAMIDAYKARHGV